MRAIPAMLLGNCIALTSICVQAQTAATEAVASSTPVAEAQQPDKSQPLEEIIVTAQKREENLQKVPISITALRAEDLKSANITSSRDLTLVTPGLVYANNGVLGSPVIRGVWTRGTGPGDEPSVPVYIDGVYQSTVHGGFFAFNNVERIEVLKGPQGTLFGRNALGGAINVITYAPSFTLTAKADVSYGTDNEVQANAYVSGPLIGDTLAVSLAAHHDSRDGYIPNLFSGGKNGAAKYDGAQLKLLWNLSDVAKITFGGMYARYSDNTAYSAYPLDGNTIAKRLDPNAIIAPPGETAVNNIYDRGKNGMVYGNVTWDFNTFQLTAQASWFTMRDIFRGDSDASAIEYAYLRIPTFDDSYTAEVRLASTGVRKIDWIVGTNVFKDVGAYGLTDNDYLFVSKSSPTGSLVSLISNIHTYAFAAFGEATYHLTDRLRVTAGLRYNWEHRKKDLLRAITPFSALPVVGLNYDFKLRDLAPLVDLGSAKKTYQNVSARASVQYDFDSNAHGFFTFSQGFKSGFFNASSAPPYVALKPEKVNNFEIGLKTEPSRRVRLNVTAFYMSYKNLQVSARSANAGSTSDVFNAADATNYGGELQLDWVPIDGFSVRSGVANQHARYKEFPGALAYFAATSTDASLTNPCVQGTGVLLGGNRSANCNVKGVALQKSPDWTADVAVNYAFTAFKGKAEVGGIVYWSDDFVWDLVGNLDDGGSYATVNAHASWATANDRLKVTLFSSNLTDKRYPLSRLQTPAATEAVLARGRTVGIRLGVDY